MLSDGVDFSRHEGASPQELPVASAETVVDQNVRKAMSAPARRLMIAVIVASAAAAGVNAAFAAAGRGNALSPFFICTCILLYVVGALFLAEEIRSAKRKRTPALNRYTFYREYFGADVTKDGEHVLYEEIYYRDLEKVKFTREYILLYVNKINAYAVKKDALPPTALKNLTAAIKAARKG